MSWREDIRDATFRGLSFTATGSSGSHGRRGTDHEFPERNEPYAEDSGRRQRRYPVTGFIAGDDYLKHLKRMINAAEKEGAAELVHPWLGRMTVVCRDLTWELSVEEGGSADLSFTLVEAGALVNPASVSSTADQVSEASSALLDAAEDDYGVLDDIARSTHEAAVWTENAKDKTALVVDAIVGPFSYTVDNLYDVAIALAAIDTLLVTTAATPSILAARTKNALQILASLSVFKVLAGDDAQQAAELPTLPTATETNVQALLEANRAIYQRMTIARQAYLLSLEDFTSYDQAIAERDSLTGLIDAEFLTNPTDALYLSLIDLRTAVQTDIDARAQTLPRIIEMTIDHPRTSLEIAQELYGDATRAPEIVTRNNVAHPAFIAGTIQVLSR